MEKKLTDAFVEALMIDKNLVTDTLKYIDEMVTILREKLNFQTMKIIYDNIQNGTKIAKSDSVILGTIN